MENTRALLESALAIVESIEKVDSDKQLTPAISLWVKIIAAAAAAAQTIKILHDEFAE